MFLSPTDISTDWNNFQINVPRCKTQPVLDLEVTARLPHLLQSRPPGWMRSKWEDPRHALSATGITPHWRRDDREAPGSNTGVCLPRAQQHHRGRIIQHCRLRWEVPSENSSITWQHPIPCLCLQPNLLRQQKGRLNKLLLKNSFYQSWWAIRKPTTTDC